MHDRFYFVYFPLFCLTVLTVRAWELRFHLESSWPEAVLIRLSSCTTLPFCLSGPLSSWAGRMLSCSPRNLWFIFGFNFWFLPWQQSSLDSFYILTRSRGLLLKLFGSMKFQDALTWNFSIITWHSCCIFSSSRCWASASWKKKKKHLTENNPFLGVFTFLWVCTIETEWTTSWWKYCILSYEEVWS